MPATKNAYRIFPFDCWFLVRFSYANPLRKRCEVSAQLGIERDIIFFPVFWVGVCRVFKFLFVCLDAAFQNLDPVAGFSHPILAAPLLGPTRLMSPVCGVNLRSSGCGVGLGMGAPVSRQSRIQSFRTSCIRRKTLPLFSYSFKLAFNENCKNFPRRC